jgi:2,4-dienoyl-CoA reductase-like NADH-dependent reductase (Old Yellow Enzyme family)
MSTLFEPATIHTLDLRNRFVRSATWTGTASDQGEVTDEMMSCMAKLADGGVGLIVTGHTFVSPEGRASAKQAAIFEDRFVSGLRRLTDNVHEHKGKIALQLAHAGLFPAEGAPLPILAVSKMEDKPDSEQRTLSVSDIQRIKDAYIQAGLRAKTAGFDAVQLHSAHGYLLSQFLSPYFNKRTDEYGGDPTRRAKIHVEIIQGLRDVLGRDFPILIKMNGNDYLEGGLVQEDAAEAASLFEKAGCNAVEVSGGFLRSVKFSPSRMGINTEKKEAYFQEAARCIKQRVGIPLILVGGIRSLHVAKAMIDTEAADFVALSRPFICEPNLILRWHQGDERPSVCKSDNRCFKSGFEGLGITCAHI